LEGYSEDLDFPCVYAWVEHEKADDREMAEEPRYNVYLKHDQYDEDDQVQVYAGDDADACRRAILALHGRVLGSSDEGACLGSIAEFGDGSIYVLYDDEEWRDYEERENGAIRYILRDGEWVTPCGVSVATLIDLMEVK
jgi:hypothetical protein